MPEPHTQDVFYLPDLGEGLAEAEIVEWHVREGDHVVADQPLVAVETDKAIVDIPAPRAGCIKALCAQVGQRIPVGAALVTFESDDATAAQRIDRGSVVGELPEAAARKPNLLRRASVTASPKARQRARELGVALTSVTGQGPNGAIGVRDVERAAAEGDGGLKGVRRAMAQRMADAHARVARATVTGEADISAWHEGAVIIERLIRASGIACLAQPRLNASFDDATYTLTEQTIVNLGIAMETEAGLFVPVLTDINASDTAYIAAELARLKAAVAERTIQPEALRGQSITLSNFGAVGGLYAEMIVVPPQVAIIGAGRVFQRLSLDAHQPKAHRFLPISISFDHRVITGVEACEFLIAMTRDLELPS